MTGRAPSGQALAVPVEPASGLAPTGFDPSRKLKVLSLFAGIGGFDLGLERTGGFETVAFCEFDKKAQQVLRKHWPEVPIYDDVRTLSGGRIAADGVAVDCIVGGFPCQDISTAGAGAGIAEGTRSGLWLEFARLIRELRPSFVIVENVSALLGRGLDTVLGDLAALGYGAWWDCIPASAVGAPHRRDRVWIVAYPASDRREKRRPRNQGRNDNSPCQQRVWNEPCGDSAGNGARLAIVGDAASVGLEEPGRMGLASGAAPCREGQADNAVHAGWWASEPAVGRVAHGLSGRVDRLKQLGNAVVPQIPELIGRAILASLQQEAA